MDTSPSKHTDQQEGGVHDGRSVQHGGHEDVVSGTVDERDVPDQPEVAAAGRPAAREAVLLGGAGRDVASGPRTLLVVAFEHLGVGITWERDVRLEQIHNQMPVFNKDARHNHSLHKLQQNELGRAQLT